MATLTAQHPPAWDGVPTFVEFERAWRAQRTHLNLPTESRAFWAASYENKYGRRPDGSIVRKSDEDRVETLFEKTLSHTEDLRNPEQSALKSIYQDATPLSKEIGVSRENLLRILKSRYGYPPENGHGRLRRE